jgi:hypothetical protein
VVTNKELHFDWTRHSPYGGHLAVPFNSLTDVINKSRQKNYSYLNQQDNRYIN